MTETTTHTYVRPSEVGAVRGQASLFWGTVEDQQTLLVPRRYEDDWLILTPSEPAGGVGFRLTEGDVDPTIVALYGATHRGSYAYSPCAYNVIQLPVPQVDTTEVDGLKVQVENLRSAVATLQAQHQTVRQAIIDEAKERQWCDEVNDFLDRVGYEKWETTYEVTLTYKIEITQAGCDDEDHAVQCALDELFADRYNHELEDSSVEEV